MIQGEEGVEGVYGFSRWTSWSSLFQRPIGVSTLSIWGEWLPNLNKTLWVIRKKEHLSRWLARATFLLLISICSSCPTFLYMCKKCVNICEVDVLSLGFRVSFRLSGYIFWFYIGFNFICWYNDFIRACKVIIFCSIWCCTLIVLGHELGQVRYLSLCPFSNDQI